jgi:hypothetical protein
MIYRSRLPDAEIADRPRHRHKPRILPAEVADDEQSGMKLVAHGTLL